MPPRISYSKKTKCQGCAALLSKIDEKGDKVFVCGLGLAISYIMEPALKLNIAVSPKPEQKCWKPVQKKDYKELLKKLTAVKAKVNEA